MEGDPLKRILQEADAAAGTPPHVPEDLARRVPELAVRRRRVRFGLSAAAALALAVGATSLLWEPAGLPEPRNGFEAPVVLKPGDRPDVADLRAEIERLGREADWRLAVARRTQEILEQMRRAEALRQQEPVPDPVAAARREVDRAAYVLVRQADRMCREMDLCDSAVVKYRRVVELFPDTPWATVARQRLGEIEKKGEIS